MGYIWTSLIKTSVEQWLGLQDFFANDQTFQLEFYSNPDPCAHDGSMVLVYMLT